ncbi:hypothetical protein ACJRO7_003770 [Eucalyptus globulus]|uniref:C2H2-type domain-containing protein n=1 Tax=Eucalyptus globulus TaxID=34317 RepID=A0ABD3IUW7_EUCGL
MALSNANPLPLGGSSSDAMARIARAEYDRRNRSLPHPKYGPYRCPRCNFSFATSQTFASHMSSHYRLESEEERRMRLEEKHRRRGKRQGPARPRPLARALARPLAMAITFRPIRMSWPALATIENVPVPAKTENVGLQGKEIKKEMADVQGVGRAFGIREIKEEPVV